jgi:hypothetical protein
MNNSRFRVCVRYGIEIEMEKKVKLFFCFEKPTNFMFCVNYASYMEFAPSKMMTARKFSHELPYILITLSWH